MANLGDIRYIKRPDGRGTRRQVYSKCPTCGYTRWIYSNRSGYCVSCCSRSKGQSRRGKTSWGDGKGYLFTSVPVGDKLECMLHKSGRTREHRLVMARYLGRPLTDNEEVHHKNGIKSDNRIDNLELLSKVEHSRLEITRRWRTGAL